MTTRALIADDEEAPRAQLRAALARAWPELAIVAEATNGVDAWDGWLEHAPDVCFLDIRMPGLSGIEVASRIAGRTPVVFVSAFGDHALAAFDAGAVDYLMKPIDPDRAAAMVERVRRRVGAPTPDRLQALLGSLVGELRRPVPLQVVQANVGNQVRMIRVDQVAYFEADARYTRVVHEAGDALIRTPLKELLVQLDDRSFWQVHRSYIVNHRAITAAIRSGDGVMHLALHDRTERIPVSRQFQGLFKGQ